MFLFFKKWLIFSHTSFEILGAKKFSFKIFLFSSNLCSETLLFRHLSNMLTTPKKKLYDFAKINLRGLKTGGKFFTCFRYPQFLSWVELQNPLQFVLLWSLLTLFYLNGTQVLHQWNRRVH